MIIIAFDPGRLTSYARLDSGTPHEVEVGELEIIGAGRLRRPCPLHLKEVSRGADCAVVEEVGARPEQGASAVFTFGMSVGTILGALSAMELPVEMVTPQKWKGSARLGGLSKDRAKTAAREMATELWPSRKSVFRVKKNHGLAEAALMARWYFLRGPGQDVKLEGSLPAPD